MKIISITCMLCVDVVSVIKFLDKISNKNRRNLAQLDNEAQ